MKDASVNHRGGHNRAFTQEQESVLRDIVLASSPAMGHRQIQVAALELKRDTEIASGHIHNHRSDTPFTASDCFITGFKNR